MRLIYHVLGALMLWIFVDALAGWFVHDPNAFPLSITRVVTDPMYKPIRGVIGGFYQGPIDFSPLIVLLALSAIRRALHRAAFDLPKPPN